MSLFGKSGGFYRQNKFRRLFWPETLNISQKKIPFLSPWNIRPYRHYTAILTCSVYRGQEVFRNEVFWPTFSRHIKRYARCHLWPLTLSENSQKISARRRPSSFYREKNHTLSRCFLRFFNYRSQTKATLFRYRGHLVERLKSLIRHSSLAIFEGESAFLRFIFHFFNLFYDPLW